MSRFTELTDEELEAKAEALGVEDSSSLTRDQLEAAILEREPNATDEQVKGVRQMADRGDFVTPLERQGEEPSGADDELRELSGANEVEPAADEAADETSLGGTGGTTFGTTGNTNA